MRVICTYVEYAKATTNNKDIRLSVTISFVVYYFMNSWTDLYDWTYIGKHSSNSF